MQQTMMKIFTGIIIISVSLFINACDKSNERFSDRSSDKPSANISDQTVSPNFHKTIFIGQNIALMNFLAQKWQLISINNIPTDKFIIIDLQTIERGIFTIHSECQTIIVNIEDDALPDKMLVEQIHRDIKPCSDSFEDYLMSIVADISHFSRQENGNLVLISFQDTLQLSPISQQSN